MTELEEKLVSKTVRKRYITALVLIACLVSGSFFSLQFVIESQQHDARTINVAGLQRMLSQKMAGHVGRLIATDDYAQQQGYVEYLLQATRGFEQNHRWLTTEASEDAPTLSDDVRQLYFLGDPSLDQRVQDYIVAARNLANNERRRADLMAFEPTQADVLLRDLDAVVQQFEDEASGRVLLINRIEIVLWVATLLILLFELRFIFRPMEKGIKASLGALNRERLRALKLRQEALVASQAKSQFLASMSHELRSPLNGVFGMVELAMVEEKANRRNEYLQKSLGSAKQLLNLLNDVIDIASLDTDSLELLPMDFDLPSMIDQCIAPVAALCEAKKLAFEYHNVTPLPEVVRGDPARISQILNHLLNNAVKFTNKGAVSVRLSVTIQNKHYQMECAISDTGVGIDRANQTKIFERFQQVDSSSERPFDGSGLGLSVCRELIGIMGGELTLDSTVGKGSTFTVSLPLDKPTTVTDDPGYELNKGQVAIIDDLESSRLYLKLLFNQLGFDVEEYTGAEAFLTANNAPDRFGFIVIDQHMPEMEGADLAERLHERWGLDCPKLIMVTGNTNMLRQDERTEALFWKRFIKPIDLNLLKDNLGIRRRPSGGSAAKDRIRILIAEDNTINAEIVVQMLKSEEYQVAVAPNGKEAVDRVLQEPFDLVLMDLNMPVMDGFEATRTIKSEHGLPLPIIALTANVSAQIRRTAKDAGMCDFLTKPVERAVLMEAIDRALHDEAGEATDQDV